MAARWLVEPAEVGSFRQAQTVRPVARRVLRGILGHLHIPRQVAVFKGDLRECHTKCRGSHGMILSTSIA